MSTLSINASLGVKDKNYHVYLSLVEFQEQGYTIIYSPALDLSGYGDDQKEAKESFKISLEEFLKYTTNKKTFDKALKKLGWNIKGSKKRPKYNPPTDTELLSNNDLYSDILNNKSFSLTREPIQFAL